MEEGYPADWPEIAEQIKKEAGDKCEHCGHKHDPASGHTLTVHHLDENKTNCSRDNLVALCQRCHLHIQARYIVGQLPLPGIAIPNWWASRNLPGSPIYHQQHHQLTMSLAA